MVGGGRRCMSRWTATATTGKRSIPRLDEERTPRRVADDLDAQDFYQVKHVARSTRKPSPTAI